MAIRLSALLAGGIVAATVADLNDPVPDMAPDRAVSEHDCTKPVAGSGNLKCR